MPTRLKNPAAWYFSANAGTWCAGGSSGATLASPAITTMLPPRPSPSKCSDTFGLRSMFARLARLAVDKHGFPVPQEPDRARLREPVGPDRRQPDQVLVAQPSLDPPAEISRGIGPPAHLLGSGLLDALQQDGDEGAQHRDADRNVETGGDSRERQPEPGHAGGGEHGDRDPARR